MAEKRAQNCSRPQKRNHPIGRTFINHAGQGIWTLDQLIYEYQALPGEEHIPASLLIKALSREIASRELSRLLKSDRVSEPASIEPRKTVEALKRMPRQLYFFLWSLENTDVIPIKGILTSNQLQRSIVALVRFMRALEVMKTKKSSKIALYEHLGCVYLDLSGFARYSKQGILIGDKHLDQSTLLRRSIDCFQQAIKIEAKCGRELDAAHADVLGLLDKPFELDQNRLKSYLNPWHFLYISSALRFLNDQNLANQYQARARSLLNALDDHQNASLRKQKGLLESIYATIHYGQYLYFDFEPKNLLRLQTKLGFIQKTKNKNLVSYNPLVRNALENQLRIERKQIRHGWLEDEKQAYLTSIYRLYSQPISALERDKLIYRLGIPPVRTHGLGTTRLHTKLLQKGQKRPRNYQ